MFSNISPGPANGPCRPGAQLLDGGDGWVACRWPESKVRQWSIAATWNNDVALLGKALDILVQGTSKVVRVNVGDVCSDNDCDGCCRANTGNGRYKLIDIEKWPASELLGFDTSSPTFDVNDVNYPSAGNLRPGANGMALCYRVVGGAPPFV